MTKWTAGLVLACAVVGSVQAASWDEAVNGDLSSDRLAPTPLLLDLGANLVRGQYGLPDREYLALTLAPGHQLAALRIGAGFAIGGVRSFVGVQQGNTVTVLPEAEHATGLLGWAHIQNALPGFDVLPEIGTGFEATGFVGPLSAGTYTFCIQETSTGSGLG